MKKDEKEAGTPRERPIDRVASSTKGAAFLGLPRGFDSNSFPQTVLNDFFDRSSEAAQGGGVFQRPPSMRSRPVEREQEQRLSRVFFPLSLSCHAPLFSFALVFLAGLPPSPDLSTGASDHRSVGTLIISHSLRGAAPPRPEKPAGDDVRLAEGEDEEEEEVAIETGAATLLASPATTAAAIFGLFFGRKEAGKSLGAPLKGKASLVEARSRRRNRAEKEMREKKKAENRKSRKKVSVALEREGKRKSKLSRVEGKT